MPIYALVDTWNSAGTVFTGIGLNVTDTASAAGSLLLDLQVGGASQFSVGKSAGAFFETNLVEVRNSTNAQAFRVYNTFTDASNYERGFVRFNSNVFEIRSEAAGTGTARMVRIQAGSSAGIELETNGRTTLTGNNGVSFANNALFFASNTPDRIRIVNGAQSAGTALELQEMTAPGAPAANFVRIYAVDNGSGKTQLMAQFATGAAVQIAIEP
jgi:hypothetical protein